MRNLMLAATAIVGISALAANANAQTTADLPLTSNSSTSGSASGATIAPGTITVRLKAAMWVELSYGTDSGTKTATGKNSGVLLGSFARLYPSFSAVAANGLEYGANLEVRMNSGGVGNNSVANTLFFRRYNGYVGTPAAGRFYFGPENNALARLSAGTTMEDFDYNGGFNGDVPTSNSGNAASNSFPFLRTGAFYTTNKLVYVSPSFAGFSVGGSWEPSQSVGDLQAASASVVGPQSASIAGGSATRRNTVDVAVQYKGSLGPVALLAFAGYIQSAVVNDSTATGATAKFKGLQQEAVGARVTFGPFAIGGNFNTGTMNNNSGLIRQGQQNGQNFVVGAQYTIGPVIMGVQSINLNNAGAYSSNPLFTKSRLHEQGVVIGGAWDYAPGATLYASALYSQKHQFGQNIVTGATNTAVGNSAQARAIQVGNVFRW